MNPIYKFTIATNDNLQKVVNPTYKDDLAKEYELETNQRFYRCKLSGKISFIGVDYDYLAQMRFETEFS